MRINAAKGTTGNADKSVAQWQRFGPEDVERLNRAYTYALRSLHLVDRNDPFTEMVARKIIEGGRDRRSRPPRGQQDCDQTAGRVVTRRRSAGPPTLNVSP
jgi:hypothetical protein